MRQWLENIYDTMLKGKLRKDRTGVGRIGTFSRRAVYDLSKGFPLVTTKFTSFHNIKHELLWMLSGSTRLKYLKQNRVSIWDEWVIPKSAILRPCTVDEVIRLCKASEHFDPVEACKSLEWVIDQKYGLPFYSQQENDVCPEGRALIVVPRPTGDYRTDTIEKLRGILHFLAKNPLGSESHSSLDFIADVANLDKVQPMLPWRKRVKQEGQWENASVDIWPFEIVDGDLGPVYGKQMVAWQPGIDPDKLNAAIAELDASRYDEIPSIISALTPKPINQIQEIVDQLKNNPTSSRMIMSLWNVGELAEMALPPCHMMTQFFSEELSHGDRMSILLTKYQEYPTNCTPEILDELGIPRRRLHCQMYQRSVDEMLGEPYNIAFYALLTHMLAQVTSHEPGSFYHIHGDTHIYDNHTDGYNAVINRKPHPLPTIRLNPEVTDIFDFTAEDIKLLDYRYEAPIRMEVAV